MNYSTIIEASYDYRLVALSVLIAIFASYVALELINLITAARSKGRFTWLLWGATAMGTGIWSMHYTGMLAYRLPVPVYYHIPTVALSWFAAVCASFIALFVVSRERATGLHVLIGGVLMAVGIGAMHYTGMAAMRLSAMHRYEPMLVVLSVLVAVMICLAALGLVFQFRDDKQGKVLKTATALLMGLAIPLMHYTGMAAVSYRSGHEEPDLTNALNISAIANTAIILITFIVLGSVLMIRQWIVVFGSGSATARPLQPAHNRAR